jgi:sterol desaturase/sphingolipid hydroxylase (fatty acid hydroxylase superfamily)
MAKKYVSNKDVSVRIFKSDFMEWFSHVHPAVPHAIYIPVICAMLYVSYSGGAGPLRIGLLFLAGLALWTLFEYVGHRFAFHAGPRIEDEVRQTVSELELGEPALSKIKGFRRKHYFIAHGVHHDFPNDTKRLVMPPSVSIPLAVIFFFAFRLVFGASIAPALFAGFILGYLIYDTIHYAVHHWQLHGRVTLYLKKHHLRHHYQDSTRDYGVSSPLWDYIVGTKGRAAG